MWLGIYLYFALFPVKYIWDINIINHIPLLGGKYVQLCFVKTSAAPRNTMLEIRNALPLIKYALKQC